MSKDDYNQDAELEQENSEEDTQDAEEQTEDTQDGDPLDKLFQEDPEQVLKEAKKFRAISQRKDKKDEVQETPAPTKKSDPNDILTRKDFELSNEKKAKREIARIGDNEPEEVKSIKQDITDNWDDILSFYTPRNGKDTAEDIIEDMQDAWAIWKRRHPSKDESNPGGDLQKHVSIRPQAPKHETKEKRPSLLKQGSNPTDWYSKN